MPLQDIVRHVVDYPDANVRVRDAVLMRLGPNQCGRVDTAGLIGCTLVAGLVVNMDNETLLGLSHINPGHDKAPLSINQHCLSSQFMQYLSRCGSAFGGQFAFRFVPVTMQMEPGVHYPFYNNRPIVEDLHLVAADIESQGNIEVIPKTFRRPPNQRLGHRMEIIKTSSSITIALLSGGANASEPLFSIETPLNHTGQ